MIGAQNGTSGVDIVFLWVDGRDPKFAALKHKYLSQQFPGLSPSDQLNGDPARYFQMEEIGYAVRSVRLFAPWIRTIYVVVADGQQLPVAVLAVPGVRIVYHSEIIPDEFLPTFSSNSIEAFVHRISGLSEIFVYGNDDFMFWNETAPSYFMRGDELILRGGPLPRALARFGAHFRSGHPKISSRTAILLYDHGFSDVYMPEHAFEIFRRSTCVRAWEDLEPVVSKAAAAKFRDDDRSFFWRMIVNAYEARDHHPLRVRSWNGCDIPFAQVENSRTAASYAELRLAILKRSQREVACFNTIPPSWYDRMRRFFDDHYERAERRLHATGPTVK